MTEHKLFLTCFLLFTAKNLFIYYHLKPVLNTGKIFGNRLNLPTQSAKQHFTVFVLFQRDWQTDDDGRRHGTDLPVDTTRCIEKIKPNTVVDLQSAFRFFNFEGYKIPIPRVGGTEISRRTVLELPNFGNFNFFFGSGTASQILTIQFLTEWFCSCWESVFKSCYK